jgi:hypothetical protein
MQTEMLLCKLPSASVTEQTNDNSKPRKPEITISRQYAIISLLRVGRLQSCRM